jgi:DNA-directed RNA polymerase sigma subunit (sigma70/sigma32)
MSNVTDSYRFRDSDLDLLKTPRHRRVMYMRHVLGLTLEEVGRPFGLTRERIRQVEEQAIALIGERRG